MTCRMPTMGACKVMNKIAISKSATTSAIAQCTTRRRKTTINEEMTSRLARMKKMAVATFMEGLLRGDDDDCRHSDIEQSQGQHHLPSEAHHLIVAKARHAPTQENL